MKKILMFFFLFCGFYLYCQEDKIINYEGTSIDLDLVPFKQINEAKQDIDKDYALVDVSISNVYFKYSNKFLLDKKYDLALKYCKLAYQFNKNDPDIKYLFSMIFYSKNQILKSYYILKGSFEKPSFKRFNLETIVPFYVKVLDRLKKYKTVKSLIMNNLTDFEIANNSDTLYYLLRSLEKLDDEKNMLKYIPYIKNIGNRVHFYKILSNDNYKEFLKNHPSISTQNIFKPLSENEENYEIVNLENIEDVISFLEYEEKQNITVDTNAVDLYIKNKTNNPFLVYFILKNKSKDSKDSDIDYQGYIDKFVALKGYRDKRLFFNFYNLLSKENQGKLLSILAKINFKSYYDEDMDGYYDEKYIYEKGQLKEVDLDKNQDSIYDLILTFDKDLKPTSLSHSNLGYFYGQEDPIIIDYDTRTYYYKKFPYVAFIEIKKTNRDTTKLYLTGTNLAEPVINPDEAKKTFPHFHFDYSKIIDFNQNLDYVKDYSYTDKENNMPEFEKITILKSQFNKKGFPYKQWIYSFGKKFAYREDTNQNEKYDYMVIYDNKGNKSYGMKDIDEDSTYNVIQQFKDNKVTKTTYLSNGTNKDLNINFRKIISDYRKFDDVFERVDERLKDIN